MEISEYMFNYYNNNMQMQLKYELILTYNKAANR